MFGRFKKKQEQIVIPQEGWFTLVTSSKNKNGSLGEKVEYYDNGKLAYSWNRFRLKEETDKKNDYWLLTQYTPEGGYVLLSLSDETSSNQRHNIGMIEKLSNKQASYIVLDYIQDCHAVTERATPFSEFTSRELDSRYDHISTTAEGMLTRLKEVQKQAESGKVLYREETVKGDWAHRAYKIVEAPEGPSIAFLSEPIERETAKARLNCGVFGKRPLLKTAAGPSPS